MSAKNVGFCQGDLMIFFNLTPFHFSRFLPVDNTFTEFRAKTPSYDRSAQMSVFRKYVLICILVITLDN